jgi:predicted ATPase/DNA-binding CsgD family transcriptional regulator
MTPLARGENGSIPSHSVAGGPRRLRAVEPEARAGSAPAHPERPPGNLPLELTSFVGREREVAEVERLITINRLLTLTGPGGCGKTRLALAVAFEVVEGFADGVWWVALASLSEPELVPQAVASTLGVREAPGRSLSELLVEHLKTRKLLLVVDNCEHLIDTCAALAGTLLRACPDLRILATSREVLGVAGEVSWPVPSLSLPDPEHRRSTEELARYEAVKLFCERAKAVAPSFELTDKNATAVARVCHRLDGVPLAIELAAARVRVLSVAQISARLDDCFRLLATESRMADPRHQTIRATIDWSFELLSREERVLFRRLSVFAGGFTLETAEAVCAGEDIEAHEVLDLLSHLVEKSLVLVAEQQGGEGARYRLLETVRRYGWEKLSESSGAERVRERHARYYLYLAEEAVQELREQEAWLQRLERDHDNLRTALSWALGGRETELGLRLAAALWPFWYTHGYLSEGRGSLEAAISGSGSATTHAKAGALNGAGYIALFQGEYEAAKGFLKRSLVIYRQLEDEEGIASSLIYLGFLAVLSQRDLESIPTLYEEAASLESEIKDQRVAGNLLILSGLRAISQGDLERGAVLNEQGLVLFREIQDVQGIGHCLNNLGLLAVMQHEYDNASTLLRENLRIARESDYKLAIQYSLFGLGMAAAALGQPARAARLWGAEEAMTEAFGIQITPMARSTTGYDGYLATARSRLDEAAFSAAWSEGRAMSAEEAIDYALDTEEPTSPPSDASLLSVRELEVLRLVAEGLTDSQVAERLYLSPRTVGHHLSSIYRKLGVPSRAAAAKAALERGLI